MIINRCPVCKNIISHKELLCDTCQNKLMSAFLDNYMDRCTICDYPKINSNYLCPRCKENTGNSYKVYNAVDYADVFCRRILEDYKFLGHKNLSKVIVLVYLSCLERLGLEKEKIIITSVPSSISSLKTRGYDQMKVICQILESKYDYKYIDMFDNTDSSEKQQKQLNRSERLKATDRFILKKNLTIDKNKTIVVLDDVYTTGTTINSILTQLAKADFSSFIAITWFIEF